MSSSTYIFRVLGILVGSLLMCGVDLFLFRARKPLGIMLVVRAIIVLGQVAFFYPLAVVYLLFVCRKVHVVIPVAGGVILFLLMIFFFPIVIWGLDARVGWALRIPVDIPGYRVVFVHSPGCDFYDTFFDVTRPDGKKASICIDPDDDRWWNGQVVQQDGKLFFVHDSARVNEKHPYIDPVNGIISTGHEACLIAGLDFQ